MLFPTAKVAKDCPDCYSVQSSKASICDGTEYIGFDGTGNAVHLRKHH